jgi:uncharacterized cupin superfamily protein
MMLLDGASGATPHHHTGSSELFYLVSGSAELLAGERTLTAAAGDLIIVPPGTVHAFAAAAGSDADLLIILTPGVERLEYFGMSSGSPPARFRSRASWKSRTATTTISTTALPGRRTSPVGCDPLHLLFV